MTASLRQSRAEGGQDPGAHAGAAVHANAALSAAYRRRHTPGISTRLPAVTTLYQLPDGAEAHVQAVQRPATSAASRPSSASEWPRWLAEIAFLPGEPVRLLSRARPGGDPLVVRAGLSTFALRCEEAACVLVRVA